MSRRSKRRARLIKTPDLDQYVGEVNEALARHHLRNNTLTAPDKLFVSFYRRIPNSGETRGILSSIFTRVLNQVCSRLDQEGCVEPGEYSQDVLKHVVEKEITPLADEKY